MGSRSQPLAASLAKEVSLRVRSLAQDWRARTRDVVSLQPDDPVIDAVNTLGKGCCRSCGIARCWGTMTEDYRARMERSTDLLRRCAILRPEPMPSQQYLLDFLPLYRITGFSGGRARCYCWLLLTTLRNPVWPIFAACDIVGGGDLGALAAGVLLTPLVHGGCRHLLRPASARLALAALDGIRVDVVSYEVVGLLRFRVAHITDAMPRLYEKEEGTAR